MSNSKTIREPQPLETAYYEEDPFGLGDIDETRFKIVSKDFLPKPEELVLREPETEKISIVLDKFAVDFFRKKGKELGAPYQRMIRTLISDYVHKVTTR